MPDNNEEVVTRSIYNKAIYSRDSQMDRKVYQRANNVLPVNEPNEEEAPVVDENTGNNENSGSENTGNNDNTEPTVETPSEPTEPGNDNPPAEEQPGE
ncbi:hypothetical protein J6W34_00040 [bacterium]|nr:hypothetical protein [bacterium]